MKVSILMPVRNGEATLCRTIASLEDQRFESFEVVCVDDGSTDGTSAILGDWARRDDRVRVQRTTGLGIAGALNTGLTLARGEYVARQDADDESAPDRLAIQTAFLDANRRVAVVGTDWIEREARGFEVAKRVRFQPGDITASLLRANPLFHGSVMFRREVVTALGGYREDLPPYAEDYDLWLRVAEHGVIWNLTSVLATRWMDGTNISSTRERQQHLAALTVRWQAIRRQRRFMDSWKLWRGALSLGVPTAAKRRVRVLRGQAP